MSLSIPLHLIDKERALSMAPMAQPSANLARSLLWGPHDSILSTGITGSGHSCPVFQWALKMCTPVFQLAQEALYPPSHLASPSLDNL